MIRARGLMTQLLGSEIMLQSKLKRLPTSEGLPCSDNTFVGLDFELNLSQLLCFSLSSYPRKAFGQGALAKANRYLERSQE
jgi:hypothetical protein